MKQIIICIEGIDGAGKSTSIKQLKSIYGENCVVYSRTQKGHALARFISSHVMRRLHILQAPIYIFLSHINYHRIKKDMAGKPIVVMDRCFLSNVCYFFPRAIHNGCLLRLTLLFEPTIYPKKIFILDVDPVLGQKRDNFQKELSWLEITRNNYIQSAESEYLKPYNIQIIEDTKSTKDIVQVITGYIDEMLEEVNNEKEVTE